VVSVIGRVAAVDCIFVVRSERQTDVPLAEGTVIVIPPIAVRPPLLQDEAARAACQSGLVVSFANHYGQAEFRRGTVAGHPASMKRGPASVECVNVGGDYELVAELVAVPAPMSGQEDELVQVDACLAGAASDHDQALAAIDHMLATATFHS
jgi:hypothetical protein